MKKIVSMAFGAALLTTGAAHAAITQFDDRTLFEAASGTLTTETFNSYVSSVDISSGSEDVGDFTVSHVGTFTSAMINADGAGPFNVDGTSYVRGLGFANDVITFSFDTAINFFGVDLFAVNNDFEREVVDLEGSTYSIPILAGDALSFVGFTSTTAFSSISFRAVSGEDAGYDNVSYGVSEVPVPAAGLLLMSALGAFGVARRRKAA